MILLNSVIADRNRRVLCSLHNILELASGKCMVDGCNGTYCSTHEYKGCSLVVQRTCSKGHSCCWEPSKTSTNQRNYKLFTDNLCFASAVVLSENNFCKVQLFCKFLELPVISRSTFHSY